MPTTTPTLPPRTAINLTPPTSINLTSAALLNLTPAAIAHIKNSLKKQPQAIGIKIGVKDSGCSGKAYTLDYAIQVTSNTSIGSNPTNPSITTDTTYTNTTETSSMDDKTFTIQDIEGIKLFVDNASIAYIKGTTLDCVQEGVNELLKFINPNVVNECGCGESFQVKTIDADQQPS